MNAVISGRAGVALLVEGNTLRSIHVHDPDVLVVRRLEDYHLLFGHDADPEFFQNIPLQEAQQQLCAAVDREEALDLALILFDHDLSDETRNEAARELNDLLRQPEIVEFVERILFAKPLPQSADHDGAKRICPPKLGVARPFFQRLIDWQKVI